MKRMKKYTKRVRRIKRKVYRRKRLVKRPQKTFYFKRSLFMPGVLFSSSAATSFNSMTFSLNGVYFDASLSSPNNGLAGTYNLPNVSEFTSMFEKYSIRKIVLKFFPRNNTTSDLGQPAPVVQNAQFWNIVNDYNDASTSFAQTDLLQMPKMRTLSMLRVQTHTIVPAVQQTLYNSAVSSSYMQRFKPFVDTSTGQNTPHYGVKIYFPNSSVNASQKYDIYVQYYLAFRQPK